MSVQPKPNVAAQRWIPRHSFAWLLVAQLAVIAPHIAHLPWVIVCGWLLAAIWRTLIFQGRWPFPHVLIKIALVAICIASIRQKFGGWVGLEPSVALLITCFSFKLLESSARREAYLLLFLGYFVALTEFLFEQGLGFTLYMFVPIVLLTAALLALHQAEPLRFSWQPLRSAGAMALQALPLMLLLFLVFPRLAPLWQVPMPGAQARTGMSDEMSPGDIAQLSQSDALAFRVDFTGAVPPNAALYWRGLVMDAFDGRRWRVGEFSEAPMALVHSASLQTPPQHTQLSGVEPDELPAPTTEKAIDYRVYLEPTDRRWLYALATPQALDEGAELTWDYRLLARDPVHEKFSYRARANVGAPMDLHLDKRLRVRTLQIPAGSNPRTQAWAKTLSANASTHAQFVEVVLAYFRTQAFFYTLKPPLLGPQAIDEFLFESRRGFCEHYASSFVFAMRAGGVPARVVAGYQGGERNPLTGTLQVHQYDAHAWAEVWLRGRGWVQVDPTAAVAPQRIERGLEGAVNAGEFLANSPLSASRYRHIDWLNAMRQRLDMVNYQWTRWVVNYRDDTQSQVLRALLGDISSWRLGLLLVGGGGLALAAVAFLLLGKTARITEVAELQLYRGFLRTMARRGYPSPAGMTPTEYAHWLAQKQPQWREAEAIAACFSELSYRPLNGRQREILLRKMRRAIAKLR